MSTRLLSLKSTQSLSLTRKGQYKGHFTKCTENAKASILAATTHNQTNSHSFNLVRPRIKVFYILLLIIKFCIEWSHRQKSPLKASTLRKAQINKRNLSSSFSLHRATKSAITQPSLVVRSSAGVHLVPHVILHLMKYWLSILKKMADRAVKTELDFNKKQAVLFIAS